MAPMAGLKQLLRDSATKARLLLETNLDLLLVCCPSRLSEPSASRRLHQAIIMTFYVAAVMMADMGRYLKFTMGAREGRPRSRRHSFMSIGVVAADPRVLHENAVRNAFVQLPRTPPASRGLGWGEEI